MVKSVSSMLAVIFTFAGLICTSVAQREGISGEYNVKQLSSEEFHGCHTKRVKVSYEPTVVPGIDVGTGMGGFYDRSTFLPCTDCLLLSIHGDLEFLNGTVADASSGMWLHHAVFVNKNRKDTTCGEQTSQRFFATGNERTLVDLTANSGHRAGYYISPEDDVAMSVELMNMAQTPQTVVFTITYVFMPRPGRQTKLESKFKSIVPIWLDVGGACGSSDVPAFREKIFNYTCPGWTSTVSGQITFAAGHLHDGGTNLHIIKNGDVVCESRPSYAAGGHTGHDSEHISSMSTCSDLETRVGDEWTIQAFYNTKEHVPMAGHDGNLEPVMGIALLYTTGSNAWEIARDGTLTMKVLMYISIGIVVLLGAALLIYRSYKKKKLTGRVRIPTVDEQEEEEEEDVRLPFLENGEVPHR